MNDARDSSFDVPCSLVDGSAASKVHLLMGLENGSFSVYDLRMHERFVLLCTSKWKLLFYHTTIISYNM